MDSNRNAVLYLMLPGVTLAVVLVCGLAGCKMGTESKAAPGPTETRAQPEASEKIARLEKENAELRERVAKLEQDIRDFRRDVEHKETLLKIALDQGFSLTGPIPTRAIEAIVQKVDNASKFVMLSVGSDDGVSRGMRFHISRNGTYVGEVRVGHANRRSCRAGFIVLKPGMNIRVGDTACTRL